MVMSPKPPPLEAVAGVEAADGLGALARAEVVADGASVRGPDPPVLPACCAVAPCGDDAEACAAASDAGASPAVEAGAPSAGSPPAGSAGGAGVMRSARKTLLEPSGVTARRAVGSVASTSPIWICGGSNE